MGFSVKLHYYTCVNFWPHQISLVWDQQATVNFDPYWLFTTSTSWLGDWNSLKYAVITCHKISDHNFRKVSIYLDLLLIMLLGFIYNKGHYFQVLLSKVHAKGLHHNLYISLKHLILTQHSECLEFYICKYKATYKALHTDQCIKVLTQY